MNFDSRKYALPTNSRLQIISMVDGNFSCSILKARIYNSGTKRIQGEQFRC